MRSSRSGGCCDPIGPSRCCGKLDCESSRQRCDAGIGRHVERTAGYNVASTAAASLGDIVAARGLGLQMRGQDAAVTARFGVA